jgi:polyisoprenoid-binding protein YceI
MKILSCSIAAAAVCLAPIVHTQAQTVFAGKPGAGLTSIRIDGTSTAHDWEMEGTIIGGTIEFAEGVKLDKTQTTPAGLQGDKVSAKAHVRIPVRMIHAKVDHLPEVMDGLMQKALKEESFHYIEFLLKEMTFKGPHTAGKPFNFTVSGDMVIAGCTNKTSFPITIDTLANGDIKVSGAAPVKMTAFGIEPPAPNFGLGLMKVGPDVTNYFDWTLVPRSKK